ncbi:MAG TPA: hypothetical protein VEB22_10080, partial [Phycisphaerales bacterium]|nr:hypothetical protein [Phycisphaerales bacterium]
LHPSPDGKLVTVFTCTIYPDLARIWHACVSRSFPKDEAAIEVFQDSDEHVVDPLQAEGCDVTAPRYPLLHQQPVFTEGQWLDLARLRHDPVASARKYDPSDLPRTTAGNGSLIKLPSFPSASRELLDQYATAFEKVMGNLERLPAV